MVEHGEELDDHGHGEAQDEHEGDGVDGHHGIGLLQVHVDLGHRDGEGGFKDLQREGRREPHGVEHEEGKVDLEESRRT